MMLKRPVLLNGFMGAGKSAVGQVAASLSGVPFVDIDTAIEAEAGLTVAEVFARYGEEHFRAIERRMIEAQLADPTPRVVALGGGSLLERELRRRALQVATVISLHADVPTLVARIGDGAGRPLLASAELAQKIARMLEARAEVYAEAHAVIDTRAETIKAIAERVLRLAEHGDLAVVTGGRSYPVRVAASSAGLAELLEPLGASSTMVISDTNVAPLVRDDVRKLEERGQTAMYVLDAGERAKGLEGLVGCWLALQRAMLDRQGLILGVGGGVVTDVAGFVAGTWQRGVRWVAVPTTLLGMVDAAIGGKTAIDFGPAKNVVGVFHQPAGVFIDVSRTATEPRRSYVSGLAEVVKSALIGDPRLLSLLEEESEAVLARDPRVLVEVVRAAAGVKTGIVSRDERDTGERLQLNLGHTFGHAIEAAGGFGRWTHGEAVSLGMVAALRVGVRMGITPASVSSRTEALLQQLGLPVELPRGEVERALPLMSHDKKREGQAVRFVLVEEVGRCVVKKLPLHELSEHLLASAPKVENIV